MTASPRPNLAPAPLCSLELPCLPGFGPLSRHNNQFSATRRLLMTMLYVKMPPMTRKKLTRRLFAGGLEGGEDLIVCSSERCARNYKDLPQLHSAGSVSLALTGDELEALLCSLPVQSLETERSGKVRRRMRYLHKKQGSVIPKSLAIL